VATGFEHLHAGLADRVVVVDDKGERPGGVGGGHGAWYHRAENVGKFPRGRTRPHLLLAVLASVLLGGGCNAFRRTAPDDAPDPNPPQEVTVTVEYRQPNGCLNVVTPCDEPVVFFGS
jgi:hypothetical protein